LWRGPEPRYIDCMNIAFRSAMTVQDYLAWADSEGEFPRTELINGQIVAMTPERMIHAEIKLAAVNALRAAIVRVRAPCHAVTDGPAVRIDEHTAYGPDALVYCGEKLPATAMVVPNPVIVVEVLSPTTRHSDTSAKLIGYFKLPSVCHYLIIDPDSRTVTHHARATDGTISARTLTTGALHLDPPGIELRAADFFEAP
jgi:Uma2 family endonuclease